MSHTHGMQVCYSRHNLLEEAVDLFGGHVALLDSCVKVSARAVLHDLTPMLLLILDEVHRFDHIDVV